MARPVELDVPHWAIDVVGMAREQIQFDSKVTDRMIYARILRNEDNGVVGQAYINNLLSLNKEVV